MQYLLGLDLGLTGWLIAFLTWHFLPLARYSVQEMQRQRFNEQVKLFWLLLRMYLHMRVLTCCNLLAICRA